MGQQKASKPTEVPPTPRTTGATTSPPRCVHRLVGKRVWDTSGSLVAFADRRLRWPQGVAF
jgi:hypothetical protein